MTMLNVKGWKGSMYAHASCHSLVTLQLRVLYVVQICTDFLSASDRALAREKIHLVDRQLACMPIQSLEGQSYLAAMAAAANFAFANRSLIMSEVRSAFEKTFGKSAREVWCNEGVKSGRVGNKLC